MADTILYLVDSLGLSGKTLNLVNLALRLDPKRYRAVVATFAPPTGMLVDRLRAGNVPVEYVPCSDGLNPGVVAKLLRLHREHAPAMVHCFNPRPMLYGGLAAALSRRPAIGTLSAFACTSARKQHAFLPQPLMTNSRRSRIRNRVLGRLLRHFCAVSQRSGQTFCDDNAIPRTKLRVIGYGVDVDSIERVPPDDIAKVRAQIGARPGELLLGSVGRLVEQKDYPTQLRAFASMSARVPVRMVVAGAGPLESELRGLASQLGIADRVCWLGERRDVWAILRSLDAFVIASKFEPFGVAVLEAMATGLPIIATDVNELREILDGGRAGMLVPAERPDALARAMTTVSSDADLRARLGGHASGVARERYSLPAVVAAYQGLYAELLA
jgi:glycosyltransferase involved in cell wall biosynthesis